MSETYYYCPKCGKKKLRKEYGYQYGHYGFVCDHNAEPKSWRGRRNYDAEKTPPCGLTIFRKDRDARIDDYDEQNPLVGMSNIMVPMIQKWLLRNDTNVRKKTIDVVYEGAMLDLVRRSIGDGTAVQIYWKRHTYERDDAEIKDPTAYEYQALRHEAAEFISFEGFDVRSLFGRDATVWDKGSGTNVFTEKSVGKRLKKKLVAFGQKLEAEFDSIVELARREKTRWETEQKALEGAIGIHVSPRRLSVRHYSGQTKTAALTMNHVSPTEVAAINEEFGMNIRLRITIGESVSLAPLTVKKLADMVGKSPMFNISDDMNMHDRWNGVTRRWTPADAVRLAKILDPAQVAV